MLGGAFCGCRVFPKIFTMEVDMKKLVMLRQVLILTLCAVVFSSCNRGDDLRDTSYAFGMFAAANLGQNLGTLGVIFDYDAFMQGFRGFRDGGETRLTAEEALERVLAVYESLMEGITFDDFDEDISYSLGMFMSVQVGSGIDFDYTAFMEGFRDFNEARETRLTQEMAGERIMEAMTRLEEQQEADLLLAAERNREEGEAYMAENALRPGVITTSSGLQYEVIIQGTGEMPELMDTVRVHYEGMLIDGTIFDSSLQRGTPIEFPLTAVIPGWSEGVQLMNTGSTYRFVIPSDLAYGPSGIPGAIPPNAALIFTVELLEIMR